MYRFLYKPKWIVSHVLILGLIVSMILLMFWQLRRLDEKQTLNARIAARADGAPTQLADVLRDERVSTIADGDRVEYRAVVVDGTYDVAAEFTVPNRTLDGAPGRMVVTPLRWSDTEAPILVLRGFIPQAIEDNTAPIEGAEPLSFVLTRLLEPLSTRLERRDRGASRSRQRLGCSLDDGRRRFHSGDGLGHHRLRIIRHRTRMRCLRRRFRQSGAQLPSIDACNHQGGIHADTQNQGHTQHGGSVLTLRRS